MHAKDIMTREVISITPETKLIEAIDLLIDHKISGVPVVDSGGNLAGLVTEKDLLVAYDFLGEIKAPQTAVKEFMTKDLISVGEEAMVSDISQILVRENIRRVPVVKEKKVIGIVARRDILKYFRRK